MGHENMLKLGHKNCLKIKEEMKMRSFGFGKDPSFFFFRFQGVYVPAPKRK